MGEPGYRSLAEKLNSGRIPAGVTDLVREIHVKLRNAVGQSTGAIELAYRRGVMDGYLEGHADGTAGRKPRHTPESRDALRVLGRMGKE